MTRRSSLVRLGSLLAAALGATGWRAGASWGDVETETVSCLLASEQTEGPYYIPGEKTRRNITEGKPGCR